MEKTMNKRLVSIFMSGLLILGTCFLPVIASEKSYAINLDKIATHTINTAKGMVMWGGASFGLAFMPAGTIIFTMGSSAILLCNELIKLNPSLSEMERSFYDVETLL